jgi:hypothetical protein
VLGYPAAPLYLEYVSGSPKRYDELIMHHSRAYLGSRDNLLPGELNITTAFFLMEIEQALAVWIRMAAPEYAESRPLRIILSTCQWEKCP